MVSAHPEGTALEVTVRPRAGRCRIAGVSAGRVRVEVASAPERGEATAQALAVLAEALGVPTRSLRLIQGAHHRQKVILVAGLDPETVRTRLRPLLPGGMP